jgi:hypothetical protein
MTARTISRRRAFAVSLLSGFFTTGVVLAETQLDDAQVVDLNVGELVQQTSNYAPLQDSYPTLEGTATAETHSVAAPAAMPAPIKESAPVESAPVYEPIPMEAAPCSCCNSTCCTKEKKEAAMAKMKGAYKGLFFKNDFSYLNDKCYDGPSHIGDSLKGLYGGKLDIGGEARVRFHSENNHRGLGLTGIDDEFFLTRYRLFSNLRINDYFRVYGEYLYADSSSGSNESFLFRPIEVNRGEIQNLFLETQLTDNLSVRVGRQELLFGAQRLVSPLDWANTRRTFQGVSGTYQGDDWAVDGFFTNPVTRSNATRSQVDDANEDIDFFGVYATNSKTKLGTVEAYYLGLVNDVADFDFHTVGSRISGKSEGGVLYDFEAASQFGTNSDGSDHGAGFVAAGLGRQVNLGDWKPTIWGWYDYASGADSAPFSAGDDGFNHLFPLAHKYNGFMDLFGRRNLHDINVQFITPFISPKVKLIVWAHHFFLDEATTPYNVTLSPFNAANAAGDRELGQEVDVLFNINLDARNSMLIGYSHFNAGEYYETTAGVPTDADADFFYMQYQTRF